MSELSMPVVVLLGLASFAAGLGAGYLACYRRQQKHGGGRTSAELRADLDDYRERVAASFERSAVLYHELEARHRELYQHLADGAATLVDPAAGHPRLGFAELARLAPEPEEPAALQPPLMPGFPPGVISEPADDLPAHRSPP